MNNNPVTTTVIDLSRVPLSELMSVGIIATPTITQLQQRVTKPGRSISGYNPQRTDDDDTPS